MAVVPQSSGSASLTLLTPPGTTARSLISGNERLALREVHSTRSVVVLVAASGLRQTIQSQSRVEPASLTQLRRQRPPSLQCGPKEHLDSVLTIRSQAVAARPRLVNKIGFVHLIERTLQLGRFDS